MGRTLDPNQLQGRCGGCVHFDPIWTAHRGVCRLGPIRATYCGKPSSSYRQQSQLACSRYESKLDHPTERRPDHEP